MNPCARNWMAGGMFYVEFRTGLHHSFESVCRTVLESANTKYEKTRNSKKEKDKREAEDEFERAQQR
jgi:hypothetical protein